MDAWKDMLKKLDKHCDSVKHKSAEFKMRMEKEATLNALTIR